MGITDRVIRVIIAVTIIILFFTNVISGTLGFILLIFAGIFVLTSIFGFCPVYSIFGISSCCTKKSDTK